MRSILGFIAGYITLAVIVMIGFLAGMFILGVDRVLQPESYDASMLWVLTALGITVIAAIAGGIVCQLIARSRNASIVLAVTLLVLGAAMGFAQPQPTNERPARPADQSTMEVLKAIKEVGREPLFTRITNPIGGAIGVLAGALLVKKMKLRDLDEGLHIP